MYRVLYVVGVLLLPIIWILLSYLLDISSSFLPKPYDIYEQIILLDTGFLEQILITTIRIIIGYTIGVSFGLFIGILLFKKKSARLLFLPTIQSIRSIPAVATIPFVLLWFGFSDYGKLFILLCAVGFNISISTFQVLNEFEEKHKIILKNFDKTPNTLPFILLLHYSFERLLPVFRFTFVIAISSIITIEMIGSQSGLGYILQTSRITFNLSQIFITITILGLINTILDTVIQRIHKKLIYWRKI